MGTAEGSIARMFFVRPISVVLIILTLLSALWPVFTGARFRAMVRGNIPKTDASSGGES